MFGCFSFLSKRNKGNNSNPGLVSGQFSGFPGFGAAPQVVVSPLPKSNIWAGTSNGLRYGDKLEIDIFYLDQETYEQLGYTNEQCHSNICITGTYTGDEQYQVEGDGGRRVDATFDIMGIKVRLRFFAYVS